MNAFETAQQLGISDLKTEQIVAALQTLTRVNIPCDALRAWLRETGLLIWTGERYKGPVQDAVIGFHDDEPIVKGIDNLKSAVFQHSAKEIRTTEPQHAAEIRGLIQMIANRSEDAAAMVDSFYSLGGGRPHLDLTEKEYDAQKAAALLQENQASLMSAFRETFDAALNEFNAGDYLAAANRLRVIVGVMEARQ